MRRRSSVGITYGVSNGRTGVGQRSDAGEQNRSQSWVEGKHRVEDPGRERVVEGGRESRDRVSEVARNRVTRTVVVAAERGPWHGRGKG